MHPYRHRAAGLSLVLPLLLGACANQDYPNRWAPPLRADACGNLAGTYSQNGEYGDLAKAAQGRPHLTSYLLSGLDDAQSVEESRNLSGTADRIEILDGQGTLVMRILGGKRVLKTITFSPADSTLRCDKDGAAIRVYSGFSRGKSNPLAGYESEETVLSKTADGALSVKSHSSAAGLVFMFLPMGMSATDWARFPAWTAEP